MHTSMYVSRYVCVYVGIYIYVRVFMYSVDSLTQSCRGICLTIQHVIQVLCVKG